MSYSGRQNNVQCCQVHCVASSFSRYHDIRQFVYSMSTSSFPWHFISYVILYCSVQADDHESRTLDDVKESEPEFFNRVTSVLKRAELEFGL